MDKMLYVSMNGASQAMKAQTSIAHNMANAQTIAFKAELDSFTSKKISGPGFDTRVYNVQVKHGADLSPGPMSSTGRDLDVAISGEGWIAVQSPDGSEAYTRAGNLRVEANGQLLTGSGFPVLGNQGPIALPEFEKLEIGIDGGVNILPLGATPNTIALTERIKLVNPDPELLSKGADGLFHLPAGETAEPSIDVRLSTGFLEQSNVNMVSQLISLIQGARDFETHVKLMEVAKQTDESSAQLLRLQ